ncbi:unnamed protein product [Euphydryas editha]|uniref:HTH APSES-type domain-containing protein n=1 Tax=Euphydryas editha TaxID=104508 RepID=A0AAU9V0S0_EUPED|nr:unnamed protein product [Euphydryas editha]
MEVNVLHGIIRNVDIELSENQALEAIKCPDNIQIMSIKRLKRRSEVGEWIPSEVMRIGFKCSYLPAYIYIDNLSVKNLCCVYLREKRLRELMAEFNCSYKNACNMYVRPHSISEPRQKIEIHKKEENLDINTSNSFMNLLSDENTTHKYTPLLPEFSQLFTPKRPKSQKNINNDNSNTYDTTSSTMNRSERDRCNQLDNIPQRSTDNANAHSNVYNKGKAHFSELITRLKEILFIKNLTIIAKDFIILLNAVLSG